MFFGETIASEFKGDLKTIVRQTTQLQDSDLVVFTLYLNLIIIIYHDAFEQKEHLSLKELLRLIIDFSGVVSLRGSGHFRPAGRGDSASSERIGAGVGEGGSNLQSLQELPPSHLSTLN